MTSYAKADSEYNVQGYATYQSDFSFEAGVTSFLGLRYAAPPVGDLRFRAPQPPENVTSIQKATTMPPQCIQGWNGMSPTNPWAKRATPVTSEDCLFLNVHVPSNISSDANLPVIVWIHGGGYTLGDASDEAQDFVRESGYNFISVNPQYRLGIFGFLPGQDVKDDGALNAGLLDQQFALQWVQDHIASFDGDPTRVTIWGESAGAGSFIQHIVAHGGNTQPPLFKAAMMSSTFVPFQYAYNDTISEALYHEILVQTFCDSADDRLSCLRGQEAYVLSAANVAVSEANFYGTFTFVPVVDFELIVERPSVTLNKSQVNGEALLAVTNSFEGLFFLNTTAVEQMTLEQYLTLLFSRLDDTQIRHTVDLYLNISNAADVVSQAGAAMGENVFICPTYWALQAFGTKAWKGEFAVPPALHASDLPYYFGTDPTRPSFNNTDFFNAFSGSFFNFALFHNESHKINSSTITPRWSQWSDGHTEMLFNRSITDEPVVETFHTDDELMERCEWWRSLGAVNGQ
ncbi:alpha/beta-hydrolase [Stereum hirsutum FP-91666 SS1]|uniref:alpha/beta-hydrolase n=1 Tax=Stereum hirsutum (strain FP-91666) TaxID=721885 RepID=UPI000440C12A|nr:alpha/beta-hydrolase [Stereum hirsutum FP-91666 SS1]EIM89549.1 alpha/beta-hydrolase [Stereum hirsutum FP-91666 SS1]